MSRELTEFNKEEIKKAEEISRGDKEFEKGDLSKAYYFYVRDKGY